MLVLDGETHFQKTHIHVKEASKKRHWHNPRLSNPDVSLGLAGPATEPG